MIRKTILSLTTLALLLLTGCSPVPAAPAAGIHVLAAETFLADITAQVTGDRAVVEALMPAGLDPHAFEPTPRDAARIGESTLLVINGGGVEAWLEPLLQQTGAGKPVIVASSGLTPRNPSPREAASEHAGETDPHFWLDPLLVVQYVENIRAGLTQVDTAGGDVYAKNAAAYSAQLRDLDVWIRQQIDQIPPQRRQLVTNHESLGYFADRYGLQIIGAVVPSVSAISSPSAQQMAQLSDAIRAAGAPAIFLETGTNPALAEQIAAETGAKVITGLYTHSVGAGQNLAATYIEMMKHNTTLIVVALK